MPRIGSASRVRALAIAFSALLPAACVAPEPEGPAPSDNAFVGTWSTSENHHITFRLDTVVPGQAGIANAAYDKEHCNGRFHFAYENASRATLTALAGRQPDVRGELSQLLTKPEYQVAHLNCDQGDNTYVLLDDHRVLAIYRDEDIARVENLTRS